MSESDCVFFFPKFIYMSDHPQICILSTRHNIDCVEVDPGGYYVDEMMRCYCFIMQSVGAGPAAALDC